MAKPNWITVNPSSGIGAGMFRITFAQNTSTSSRSGIVTVKSLSGLTHEIQVTQAGKPTKGKITFRYTTGGEIPQEYVGYTLYIGLSNDTFTESYADYGEIESITANTMVVNFNNMSLVNLDVTLSTIKSDMTKTDDIYFGISPSDDPGAEWVPLLYVTEIGSETFTSDNMAVIIQDAFNGISTVIDAEILVTPSVTDIICSWSMPSTRLLLASSTQAVLDEASVSYVNFRVFADLYPDGERLNDNSMNNIQIGQFTLGQAPDGKWLSRYVNVSRTNPIHQFTWYKEWSNVALCRFTIKCDNFNETDVSLNENLVINGKTFMQYKDGGNIYFENTEGIPLQKTSDGQNVNISSNIPDLNFDFFA